MTGKRLVRALTTLLVLSALMAASGVAAQTAKSEQTSGSCLSVSLSAVHNKDKVKLGEPVLVDITMENHCDRLDFQHYVWRYSFSVRDDQGNLAWSRLGRVRADPQHKGALPGDLDQLSSGGSWPVRQLAPDETAVFNNVPVSDLWDLSKPGSYTISVHRRDAYGKTATSNEITVTVTP